MAVLFLALLQSIKKQLPGNCLMNFNTLPLHCTLILSCSKSYQKEVHSHLAFPAIFGNKTIFLIWNSHLLFVRSHGHLSHSGFLCWCSPHLQQVTLGLRSKMCNFDSSALVTYCVGDGFSLTGWRIMGQYQKKIIPCPISSAVHFSPWTTAHHFSSCA